MVTMALFEGTLMRLLSLCILLADMHVHFAISSFNI